MPRAVHAFVYLASQSPRRRQLLTQIGVAHELLLPGPQEDAEALEAMRLGELPQAYVQRVTQAKLLEARARLKARKLPLAPILCADTTVAVGRRILGKPLDAADALAMLQLLSGRSHRVLTAVAVWDGRRTHSALQVSRVQVAPLSTDWLHAYIASGEPFGKAGAYGIQGAMGAKVEAIAGSYSGIMGLPLFEAAAMLALAGVAIGTAEGSEQGNAPGNAPGNEQGGT